MPRSTDLVRHALAHAILLATISQAGLSADPAPVQSFEYHHADILGTAMDLTVIAPGKDVADATEKSVLRELERLRLILSTYDDSAELAKFNAMPAEATVTASPELLDALRQYDEWAKKSRRAYSAQTGRLIAIWKRAEKDQKLPPDSRLAAAAMQLNKPAWQIDPKTQVLRRISSEQINVDSLGKGYIVGRAVEAATRESKSITGLLLNIGGDIRVWGSPLDGNAWSIGVQDPKSPALNATPLTTLRVPGDTAIASSGGYQRFYEIDGKRYSHILDARTGQPAKSLAATVVAPDSATANALATICCIVKPADAFEIVRSVPGAECLIVTGDGRVARSDGFKRLESSDAVTRNTPNAPAGIGPGPDATNAWPSGFAVQVDLETVQMRHKPYVFVWITDSAGKHIKTIGAWGNERKYLRDIREWWKHARVDSSLQGITHATQRAGRYPLVWDGTDQKGKAVPTGTYSLWIEVAAEDGPHAAKSIPITCGQSPDTFTLTGTKAFKDVSITYDKSTQSN
jgi:thiamine biosynthesis lipoprotein ApbE